MKNRSQSTLEAPNNETPKKGAARGFNDWFGCLILLALLFAGLFLLEMYSGVVSYAFGTAKDTIADTLSAVGVDGIQTITGLCWTSILMLIMATDCAK